MKLPDGLGFAHPWLLLLLLALPLLALLQGGWENVQRPTFNVQRRSKSQRRDRLTWTLNVER